MGGGLLVVTLKPFPGTVNMKKHEVTYSHPHVM